ncbi:hypothetical protein MCHI_000055 [Candidatus Magnetoovum chiemensis]|nr:hypothetical protein MCHI_000055 [Candidatus Magnetoovum chiemensis]
MCVGPVEAQVAFIVVIWFNSAVEFNDIDILRSFDFPWIAVS